MIEKIRKTREYLDYLERHYNNVQDAWKLLQEKCSDMEFICSSRIFNSIDKLVKNHDDSKLSKDEFVQYRKYFFPVSKSEKKKSGFRTAWEKHLDLNEHHWQNWTKKDSKFFETRGSIYLINNIVDWIAMGFEKDDTAKEYYENNKDKIILPDWSIKLMYEIFDRIY